MINSMLGDLVRDARIGARMLVKTPLFTIFAVVVLSIGIGANVTIFTYLNAVFLKPLDVPRPHRFLRIYGDGEGPNGGISYEAYERYRDGNQSFSNIGMYVGAGTTPLRLQGSRTLPIDIVPVTVTNASLYSAVGRTNNDSSTNGCCTGSQRSDRSFPHVSSTACRLPCPRAITSALGDFLAAMLCAGISATRRLRSSPM